MNNKITMLLLSFTLIIGCIISSPITAYAEDPVVTAGKLTGNEDASNLNDFDGNITVQNIFKIWSTLKSLGYTDEQAAGTMGCMQAECHFHAEVVESHCDTGDTEDKYNEYVEKYSQPFVDDTDTFTVNCLKTYDSAGTFPGCGQDATIAAARQENDITDNGLHEPTYFVDGIGYVGVGLCGYTGEGCQSLINFAKTNNIDWYNIDNQMIWSMTNEDEGGYSRYKVYSEYMSETSSQCVDDCTHWFATNMINGNFKNPSPGSRMAKELQLRQQYAQAIYKEMHGKSWDSTYGNSIVSGAGLQPSAAKNGINDKSILFSYASNVLYFPKNVGFLLKLEDNSDMYNKNMKVYKGYIKSLQGKTDDSQKYSLFELFGEDIHWYRYLGEKTYAPQLLDHIWSAVEQKRTSKLVSVQTINYEAVNYLSCRVYEDRPYVLTQEDQENGYNDPRVLSFNNSLLNGYEYTIGNMCLSISKRLVALMSLLMGHEILDTVVDMITKIESTEIFEVIKTPILFLVGFAMIAFILSLVGKGVKYAKGEGSFKEALTRFLVGIACLGMIFASVERPDVFNDIIVKSLTIIDQVFEASLSNSVDGDEVIDVKDDDMIVQAAIWKTAIFNSWCRGQFDNREYDELYTNLSGKSESKWMPMSRQTGPPVGSVGQPYFNTSNAVHEELVVVPIGGGTKVYNWAAYLYSCNSKYHIDSSLNEEKANSIDLSTAKLGFPMAKTTANNSELLADTFRVIDAQMDISPQLYENGSKSTNYTNSHVLNTHYASEGIKMIFNTSLLAFMIPVVFKKLLSFIMMLLTSLKMIYFTLLELFKEKSGWDDFLQSLKKDFFDYITASIKINIMVIFYMKFVDKGLFMTIIYILLCLVVLGFNWEDMRRNINNAKHTLSKAKNIL